MMEALSRNGTLDVLFDEARSGPEYDVFEVTPTDFAELPDQWPTQEGVTYKPFGSSCDVFVRHDVYTAGRYVSWSLACLLFPTALLLSAALSALLGITLITGQVPGQVKSLFY